MMEYQGTAMAAQAIRPSPELGRLKAAAERIARASNNVDNFLVRFHGPTPEATNSLNGPTTDSYRNDLEAVFAALDRLETAVASLDHIG